MTEKSEISPYVAWHLASATAHKITPGGMLLAACHRLVLAAEPETSLESPISQKIVDLHEATAKQHTRTGPRRNRPANVIK